MITLKSAYGFKREFVSDFLKYCKEIKDKYSNDKGNYFHNKVIAIEGELWTFKIYIQSSKLYLQPILCVNGQFVHYPKEQWNNIYKDTFYEDSLETFLNREIKKGVEKYENY